MTTSGAGKKPGRARAKAPVAEAPSELTMTLDYELHALPTAQHRAGLAGLVLMLKWLERLPGKEKGTARLLRLDEAGASVALDLEGLRRLFNELFAASMEEQRESQPRKDEPPLREEEVEQTDVKGKVKRKKSFIYKVPVPRAGLLLDLAPGANDAGLWVKLWRDMLWKTLRGVPATRNPFIARAQGTDSGDAEKAWKRLTSKKPLTVQLSSTDFLGAMDRNADGVSFEDSPRDWFLLHFWPYVTQVYVPRALKLKDKALQAEHAGFALVIPDVGRLQSFCEELPHALRERSAEVGGFRPRAALVDLVEESALVTGRLLRERLSRTEGAQADGALVLGYELVHLDKEGNNVRTYSASRFEPTVSMVDEYQALQHPALWDPLYRRTRLQNLVGRRPWYAGFDRIASTLPYTATFGAKGFRHDARVSFERSKDMEPNEATDASTGLEQLVLQVAGTYVRRKVKLKHGLEWEGVKDDPKKKAEYEKEKERIARDAFLAVRSRTGADFIGYFAGTLCSVPHHLKAEQFVRLSRALHERTDDVRTLTLLALSATA
ncbi:type I-MYXAN CRISPR-associated protein Cmx8 [Myxococcus vastator]|uniref:type I-MYXAN CRISPR-associated protein Cmx8 n=1 Tax=Myxococcus vastator TaxID=2709664 RepID=UPI0013CF71FA|nr:type I-MYXAN CRISPR-associated protein Cmx8 [Myxococcus vastator]